MISNLTNKPTLTNIILICIIIAPIIQISFIAEIFDLNSITEQLNLAWLNIEKTPISKVVSNNHIYTALGQKLSETASSFPSISTILSTIICAVCGVFLTRLTIRSTVFLNHLFTPAIPYLIASVPLLVSSHSIAWAISSLLIIKSLGVAIQSYTIKGNATGRWFMCGFYMALASIVFIPSVILCLCLFCGLFTIRRANLKELISLISGVSIPLIYTYIIELSLGIQNPTNSIGEIANYLTNINPKLAWSNMFNGTMDWSKISSTAYYSAMVLVLIISIIFISTKRTFEMKPKNLASFRFFSLTCFICLLSISLLANNPQNTLAILAIPAGTIIPMYLCGKRHKTFGNILYCCYIILGLIFIYTNI